MTAILDPVLQREKDESFTDYHIRLFKNKDTYHIDTKTIAALLNKDQGTNYDESKWRKDFKQYERWNDYIMSKNLDEEILKKYEEVRLQSEKEKIRTRDQKREYRKSIANQARFEKIKDDVVQAIVNLESKDLFVSLTPSLQLLKSMGLLYSVTGTSEWKSITASISSIKNIR